LTGSYGVNVFGYDFYKECIERGAERVAAWGRCWAPISGDRLQRAPPAADFRSGRDFFHMSAPKR